MTQLGYYFATGKFGNYFDEVKDYTDLQHIWAYMQYAQNENETPDDWLPRIRPDAERAVKAGKRIYLALNLQEKTPSYETPVGRVINQMKPFWDFVDYIELADEPSWTFADAKAERSRVVVEILEKKLTIPKLCYVHNAAWVAEHHRINELFNAVFIEAYMDPPGLSSGHPPSEYDVHADRIALHGALDEAVLAVPASVGIGIVGQAYARNPKKGAGVNGPFNWDHLPSLRGLQRSYLDYAFDLGERCHAVTLFNYGRPGGGTRQLDKQLQAGLVDIHRDFWWKLKERENEQPTPVPPAPAPPDPPVPPPKPPSWWDKFKDWH